MKNFEKSSKEKSLKSIVLKSAIIELLVTAVFIFIFGAVMYFTESAYEYASVFATAAIAIGSFITAYYAARKLGKHGFFIGFITGGITFLIITIISLIIDKGALTANTLFHFIIIMLSSLIGGIIGVNKSVNKKYI